jgi:prefoldin subunit 5
MIGKELNLDEDIERYQKRMNELYKGRKNIIENIKELTRRQRYMGDRETKDLLQIKS